MTPFERYRPAIALFFMGCAMVPLTFGAVVMRDGSPITPEQYGEVVWMVPALAWAAVQLGGSALAVAGCLAHAPRIAAMGCTVVAMMMLTLAAGALSAGATGTLVVAGCGFWLGPLSCMAAGVCWFGRR